MPIAPRIKESKSRRVFYGCDCLAGTIFERDGHFYPQTLSGLQLPPCSTYCEATRTLRVIAGERSAVNIGRSHAGYISGTAKRAAAFDKSGRLIGVFASKKLAIGAAISAFQGQTRLPGI